MVTPGGDRGLVSVLLMEHDEKWITGKKYFGMEEYLWGHEGKISAQALKVSSKVTRLF